MLINHPVVQVFASRRVCINKESFNKYCIVLSHWIILPYEPHDGISHQLLCDVQKVKPLIQKHLTSLHIQSRFYWDIRILLFFDFKQANLICGHYLVESFWFRYWCWFQRTFIVWWDTETKKKVKCSMYSRKIII